MRVVWVYVKPHNHASRCDAHRRGALLKTCAGAGGVECHDGPVTGSKEAVIEVKAIVEGFR
jgi:hypothetical protein